MRWLFLALVAANVGFYAWHATTEVPPSPEREGSARPAESGLRLLAELEAPPPVRTADISPSAMQPTVTPVSQSAARSESAMLVPNKVAAELRPAVLSNCYKIQGLEDPRTGDQLVKTLTQAGATLIGRGEYRTQITRYWVMWPPRKSKAAAEDLLRQLRRAKIRDHYLVRSGDNINAISLGVFSTKAAAEERLARILRLKLKAPRPHIAELTLPSKRYWIGLGWHRERGEWRAILEAHPGATVEPATCP